MKLCASCKRDRQVWARGLCTSCYPRHLAAGTHVDFERRNRPRSELLEEWEMLRAQGLSRRQAAERLGMKDDSLYAALRRAGVAS